MKTDTSKVKKVVNLMIVGLIAAGAVIFAVLSQATSGRELMPTMFLAFFGAIITVQVIPGIVLLGSILKGVINMGRKQVPAKVSVHNNSHK